MNSGEFQFTIQHHIVCEKVWYIVKQNMYEIGHKHCLINNLRKCVLTSRLSLDDILYCN